MTIKELKREYKRRLEFSARVNPSEVMQMYYETMFHSFMEIYNEGFTRNFDMDFERFVRGYQNTQCEYDNLHILTTLDLHSISASRAVVRKMLEVWLVG